jgi:hypothetical protein
MTAALSDIEITWSRTASSRDRRAVDFAILIPLN